MGRLLNAMQALFPNPDMVPRRGNRYTKETHTAVEKLADLAEYEHRINGVFKFKEKCVSLFFKHTQDLFEAHRIGRALTNGKCRMACVKDPSHSFIELKVGWELPNANKVVMKAISCPFNPPQGMLDETFEDYTMVQRASAFHSFEIAMTTFDGAVRNEVIRVNIATGVTPEHKLPDWFVQCMKSII